MKFFIIIKDQSERIPHKNFQLIGDTPLWLHLINELFGMDVYIDTDSDEVIKTCESLSWVTCYRRESEFVDLELSSDVSPVLLMINNFLDKYVSDDEVVITTHVTSPFLKLTTIKNAVSLLDSGKYDSIHSVTKHKEFSWFGNDSKPINYDPKVVQKTQDLEPIIMSNGAFFIFKKCMFKSIGNRIGLFPYYYELNYPECVEIDTPNDLELSRLIYKGLS